MKIGNYKVPDLRLFPDIHNDIKLMYDNYRLEEAKNEDTVAKLLKHKHASGGAWWSKLADMRLYGLLEPRGMKLTPLAEKLTYGTEQEKQEAIKKTILNVPLWKELYGKFGKGLPDSNFWVQLQRITGLGPLDARKHADSVRKAYLDDISHIKVQKKTESEGRDMQGDTIDISMSTINIQVGQYRQTIPYTKDGIEHAKGFLDLLGKQLKTEEAMSKDEVSEEKEETSEEEG